MKSSELRIGNWVFDDQNDHCKVSLLYSEKNDNYESGHYSDDGYRVEYDDDRDEIYLSDNINPIPLTEEWLKRFGFGLCEHRGYVKGEFYIGLSFNFYSDMASFKVNSVHQLQNLYFALTGEELNQNKDE